MKIRLSGGEELSVQATDVMQVAEDFDTDRLVQAARLDRGEASHRDQPAGRRGGHIVVSGMEQDGAVGGTGWPRRPGAPRSPFRTPCWVH